MNGPRRRWRVHAGVAAGGAAVAFAAAVVARDGTVPGWERRLFHLVNDLPDGLRPGMWVFQLAGVLGVPLIVAVVALALRRYRLTLTLIALVPLKLLVEHGVVKQLVDRQRPATSVCGGDLGCGHFRDVSTAGPAFVSGHAIIAWAVAGLLAPYLRRPWRAVPYVVALLNSLARVYLGAHNPLDVVAGAAIGISLAALLTLVAGAPRARPRLAHGGRVPEPR